MWNKVAVLTLAALLLALMRVVEAQAPKKGTGPKEIIGPVRVIDGDTLEVYIEGRQTGIGIIGIKAPRANSPCGRKAAEFTQELLNGLDKKIKLRFEEDKDLDFDRRKRRLYYLKLPGGISAALELVRAGLAEPDGTGDEREELERAFRQAPRCIG